MQEFDPIRIRQQVANDVHDKLNDSGKRDNVVVATNAIYRRIVNAGDSLVTLSNAPEEFDWTLDGAAILRTIYDAMFQALYILHDEKQRDELAIRFLDFRIVEKKRMIRMFDGRHTKMSRQLSDSSRRAAAEPAIDAEFDRVCKKYSYKPDKLRPSWYPGQLIDLVKTTAYEHEYNILYKDLSMLAHSSPAAVAQNHAYPGEILVTMYWAFAFRVLDRLVEYHGVALNDVERGVIGLSKRCVFD